MIAYVVAIWFLIFSIPIFAVLLDTKIKFSNKKKKNLS
jgi:MFS-type transporter involved in bile tolerance (Atg22 family)